MPRPPKAFWVPPRPGRGGGYWMTKAFGELSEATGRKKGLRNADIGPPTGREGPANRAAARRWVEQLQEQAAALEARGDDPTLDDLAEQFCEWSSHRKAPRTVKGHRERLTTFGAFRPGAGLPIYGERPASQLKPTDLARWLRAMEQHGKAPLYVASILQSVMACLNWAARPVEDRTPERILAANPFAGVERPRVPAPPRRYCGAEARAAFLRYAHRRACAQPAGSAARRFDRLAVQLFRLCEQSGCRPDEACRLEWSHLDWERARAVLPGKSTHRTGRPRVVPLTEGLLRVLRAIEHLPGRNARYVFTHQPRDRQGRREGDDLAGVPWAGNALAHKVRQWRDEAIAAGEPIAATGPEALTLYAMRRDLGADVLRHGGSYAEVAEVLGNSAAVAERHYASFESKRAVDLARAVRGRDRAGTKNSRGP